MTIAINSLGMMQPPVDGRLCFGNGYVFGCFVGPLELPEKPIYKVHDKISRLWLGYSSSPSIGVGLQPVITDSKTGEKWIVGGVDNYRYENGVIFMETKLPVGKVITETYGLWQKPVFVRKIKFIPNENNSSNYLIRTSATLFKEHSNKPPAANDKEAWRFYNVYKSDERERPVSHVFPAKEILTFDKKNKSVLWDYKDDRYRKIVIKTAQKSAKTIITQKTTNHCANVVFENSCGKNGGELTIVLSFASKPRFQARASAIKLMSEYDDKILKTETTQKKWKEWFDNGAVVKTGNKKLDNAYKNQLMYVKVALDEELGGHIVGGRYQIPTMWGRDSSIAMSTLLDAGHYDEVRKMLRFYPDHLSWNKRNNCIHANFHLSGRVWKSYCSEGQKPVEDNFCYYEGTAESKYYDKNKKFKKYNSETGLIVDNCWESDILGEYSLMNALAIVGFWL